MRTDAQIDRQQVYCPNANTQGYGKYRAQFGDFVIWNNTDHTYYGRVAGRVHYAPAIDEDREPVRDWLLVIALGSNLSFAMERWVNPADVTEVFEPREQMTRFLAFFLSDAFKKEKPDALRAWSASGFATVEEYQQYLAE